ncbi:MAG: serine/threonine-protein kinase [Bacteroidales bacterium]|nr:serine/threonine-protein kinase [Bacteroidales bacterium]
MSAIPNHLQPGTMLHAGSYRIIRFIAAGGFGCTYEAEHVLLEKRVAIKEFFMQDYCNRDADTNRVTVGTQSMHEMVDKYKRKFIGEAKALSGLRHEGIISVSDVFEENGTAYFVMDYVKGQSLADLCKSGPLPEKHALYYIRQVCEALAYVHEHNRLHLDLKPANIMVEASGRTVLIDFGASKQYDAASGENTTTLLGYTPGYAPLEQTEGNVRQFLPATDIYALGATLYRLLTGHTPPSPSYRISEEEMQPLPDSISAGTRQAVEQAMMLNKKKRPQTVREFITLLDAAVKAETPRPVPPPVPGPPPPVQPVTPPKPVTPKPVQPVVPPKPEPTPNTDTAAPSKSKGRFREWIVGVIIGVVVISVVLSVVLVKGCSSGEEYDSTTDMEEFVDEPLVEEEVYTEVVSGTHAGHDFVDLGLSVYWATCNVGASSPEEYGNYYAWGEISTKNEYSENNCKTWNLSLSDIGGNSNYDAARANWGGSWRLPTKTECEELIENCTYQLTTRNGVAGMCFTSIKNGNSIFLPAAGYWNVASVVNVGTLGTYGSSTPDEVISQAVCGLGFNWNGNSYTYSDDRCSGRTVRPVLD